MQTYLSKIVIGLGIITLGSVGYNIYQSSKIDSLMLITTASVTRESINDDNFRDAFISTSQHNDLELAKNQGRIEGILLIATKQKIDESDMAQVWHDGYYRGLEQAKDTVEMLKNGKNDIDSKTKKDYIEPNKQSAAN